MIGSGIFLLPAALGKYGGVSLIGWVLSGIGGYVLAKVFADLSKRYIRSGGPYEYSKQGFGNFVGFLVAWGYWIAIIATNAAIVVTMISYLSVFFPILSSNPLVSILTGLITIWGLTWVNSKGIKEAGWIQLITTALKLIPLLLVGLVSLFFFNVDHFMPFKTSDDGYLAVITTTTTLTLFAFLGIESATIPSQNIKNPQVTISRATMIGIGVTIFVYILGTVAVMGIIPPDQLANSEAPFADAAAVIWGEGARKWVSLGFVISTLGALNGWIMMQGQIPRAAALDGLFPSIFSKENQSGMPSGSLIISSILISILMLFNYSKSLIEAFEFMILLSTLTCLVPYLFSSATHIKLGLQSKARFAWVWGTCAFIFSLWAVIGSGAEIVYWGFVILMLGIPVYVWSTRKH